MNAIRWGILATGNIAASLAEALNAATDAALVAVASRRQERAEVFGDRWGIPRRYGAYADLAADPDVDVIYIATPHSEHATDITLCLEAGKHVLCEKAFTLNAAEATEAVALARGKGLFLMEAMWMRFFPAMEQLRRWLHQGLLGSIRLLQADFCFHLPYDPAHRLYDPALGGGALLDLGIYPLSLASMVMGPPESATGHAHLAPSGVDDLDSIFLSYADGARAMLSCSQRIYRPREAFIVGTDGYVKIHDIFFRPDRLTLHLRGQRPEDHHFPIAGNGYGYEVAEVHRCLRAGRTESALMPLDETIRLMQLMDELRAAWGVVYPRETGGQAERPHA